MSKDFAEKYNFREAIDRVLKRVHPDKGIDEHAKNEMNLIIHYIIDDMVCGISQLLESDKKKTCTSRHIQSAVRLKLAGELARYANSEGTKALTKYNNTFNQSSGEKNKQSQSNRAGLKFPVAQCKNILKIKLPNCTRIGRDAPVYMAAVLEYLTAEILELAGNNSRDDKKVRITPRHMLLAIKNDEELSKMLKGATLSGGVVPYIHLSLLPKRKVNKNDFYND